MKHVAAAIVFALLALAHHVNAETPVAPSALHLVHKVYPRYPYAARDQHLEGSGLFQLQLRPDGIVRSVVILKSTGHVMLDDAAVAALRQWQFAGAVHDVKVPINFSMKGVVYVPSH
jgi:TonB family protein